MKRIALLLVMLLASTVYGAADYLHVTVAGATTQDGQTWATAFSLADFVSDMTNGAEAGDVYYIKSGTYTMAAGEPIYVLSGHDGTAANPITLIGVLSTTTHEDANVVAADYAYGTDRPYFDCATNTEEFRVNDYYIYKGLRFLTDSTNGIVGDIGMTFVNCSSTNNKNDSISYEAFTLNGVGASMFSCEATSPSGTAVKTTGANHIITNCYIHDSAVAITATSYGFTFTGNVVDTCPIGLELGPHYFFTIQNNTFYDCAAAITASTANRVSILNNIFDECAAPAAWTTETPHNRIDYNSWDGNASGNTNVTIGEHGIDSGITLNADFSVQASSAVLDAGMQQSANTGIAGADYKVNIGADQDDNTSAGSGGQHSTKQGGKQ